MNFKSKNAFRTFPTNTNANYNYNLYFYKKLNTVFLINFGPKYYFMCVCIEPDIRRSQIY